MSAHRAAHSYRQSKRHTIRKATRQQIYERDGYICRYCGQEPKPRFRYTGARNPSGGHWRTGLEIDHVIPHSLGGSDDLENLVTACEECNLRKYNNVWQPLPLGATGL